jgi:hypothetical protein
MTPSEMVQKVPLLTGFPVQISSYPKIVHFTQSLRVNSGIVPKTLGHDGYLPPFPIHHFHISFPSNAIYSQILTGSLIRPKISLVADFVMAVIDIQLPQQNFSITSENVGRSLSATL